MARSVMSSILPTGVGTIYNMPIFADKDRNNFRIGKIIMQEIVEIPALTRLRTALGQSLPCIRLNMCLLFLRYFFVISSIENRTTNGELSNN